MLHYGERRGRIVQDRTLDGTQWIEFVSPFDETLGFRKKSDMHKLGNYVTISGSTRNSEIDRLIRQFRTSIALKLAVFFSSRFIRMNETFLCGQNATGSAGHSGSNYHKLDSLRLRTDVPLDAKSAGLNSVGTRFQSLGGITSIMSDTRFDTNVFQRRGLPDIHAKVIVQSDHACIEDTLKLLESMIS